MARILFIYKQFPAPSVGHAGGESLFGLMEALRRRGHRLALVARIRDEERALLPQVEAICERVITVPHHRSIPGWRPPALARSYLALRRATKRALRELRPDLVHVETTQTAVVLLGMRLPPSSFRTQDVNWFMWQQKAVRARGLKRLLAQTMAIAFRAFEPLLCRRHDLILAISEGDRALLAPVCGDHRLQLLPLAPAALAAPDVSPAIPPGSPVLLFVGAMDRAHNLAGVTWFLDHVWPRIREVMPDACFYIVGGHPPAELRARADDESCSVTGFVDDLASWYRAATVFVSPMLVAGGLLQKVVDAMALGVPVVATSVCNHGLGATPGEHLLTADTAEEFAAAVLALLHDPEARARLGSAGRRFIQTHYDTEAVIAQWEEALGRLSRSKICS
ncbi:MAG: glycosyltransferase [Anaerolineae bacterium]|nr:glycosyltransferase [Anaerolineae bacterium]